MAGVNVEAVKESVVEGFYAAREVAEGLLADFKSRDRFFKYKAGIIGVWALFSVTTMAVACPGAHGVADNNLGARVQMTKVLNEYTSILIQNTSTTNWKDIKLQLNDVYSAYQPELAAGGRVVLRADQFSGPQGKVPAKDLRPNTLRIACDQGKYFIDFNAPTEQ